MLENVGQNGLDSSENWEDAPVSDAEQTSTIAGEYSCQIEVCSFEGICDSNFSNQVVSYHWVEQKWTSACREEIVVKLVHQ
jgi:hypothetical protein